MVSAPCWSRHSPPCFDHADGHRVFSLRSRDGFDVGVLAKKVGAALGFSGGGHAAAAGFRAPLGWEGEGK
jgi:uncharacterized protein